MQGIFELTVACFMGTGSFLIRYSNGQMKETYLQLKKFCDYF